MKTIVKVNESDIVNMSLNYDISTYEFLDLDLKMATQRLSLKDQEILILYLMGYTHQDIAELKNVDRSTISRRLKKITSILSTLMR